ncbi:MAG: hypothetical protein R8G66_34020 [Cytophagales bacterium]|nr:hypothetical protein [Cytophagales bacterium]
MEKIGRVILIVWWMLAGVGAFAQVTSKVQATGKHQKAVGQFNHRKAEVKARKAQWKAYKRQAKEARKYVKARKKLNRLYEEERSQYPDAIVCSKEDSVALVDRLMTEGKLSHKHQKTIEQYAAKDSAQWVREGRQAIKQSVPYPSDSAALAQELEDRISGTPYELPDLNRDSLTWEAMTNHTEKEAERHAEQQVSEYFPDNPELPLGEGAGLPEEVLGLSEKVSALKNPNFISPKDAQGLFDKVDPQQFQDAMLRTEKLKQKYQKLPSIEDPKNGLKRNSLSDLPFADRLYFGGNLDMPSTDPLVLDTQLQLGYWWNKHWMTGLGFGVREQFSGVSQPNSDNHGWSGFSRYHLTPSIFLWGEYSERWYRSLFGSEPANSRLVKDWGLFVGAGKDFRIGKATLFTLLLYNVNHRSNDLSNRPWLIKIGFRIDGFHRGKNNP